MTYKYQVVQVNKNSEYMNLICDNCSKYIADKIVDFLNSDLKAESEIYYSIVVIKND